MTACPELSIVVPAYNEEAVIGRLIESVQHEVTAQGASWELVVVDDGSADQTVSVVAAAAAADARVRLVQGDHRGKGAALRHGIAAARGRWVFMADADLSMPWDNLPRFIGHARRGHADVVIGSREAAGARRAGEALGRRVSGRVFNALVRLIALPGLQDTQCGYKLLSDKAARTLIPHLTIDGFAFDVELLVLARLAGFEIAEVGITCNCRHDSRVRVGAAIGACADILRVKRNTRRGTYASLVTNTPREHCV